MSDEIKGMVTCVFRPDPHQQRSGCIDPKPVPADEECGQDCCTDGKCTFVCESTPPEPVATREGVKRPTVQGGDYRPHYRKREADAYMDSLESQLKEKEERVGQLTRALRDILNRGRYGSNRREAVVPAKLMDAALDVLDGRIKPAKELSDQ